MKYYFLKTLFFIFPLFSLSQSSYNLGWSTNGESINQQLTIDVGDTVTWEWTYGTHNLVQVGDVTEPEFGEGYHSTGHQYSHTFTTPGVTIIYAAHIRVPVSYTHLTLPTIDPV